MFLRIAKEQMEYYKENVTSLIYKGDSIIEFCATPIFNKSMKISNYKKQELQKIIRKTEIITKTLRELVEIIK
ncbi:hypothetical protein J6A64_03970 [bacterium]|nr:hypothetical protein [bacterium]MBO5446014.1 hypothetical protein [bacterium]